jgi:hypothetical protein
MPGIGHILYGLALVLPVMLIARDRMNYKAVLIFLMNNYFGPDSSYPFIFLPLDGHTIAGFLVWALFLAFMYSYISRFSISRERWRFTIHDDGKIEVPYKQAYMLCAAGGISHFFIDMIGHHGYKLYLSQWFSLNLNQVQAWADPYYHEIGPIAFFGILLTMFVILLLYQVLQQDAKAQYKFILSVMGIIVAVIVFIDGKLFAEAEVSMVVMIGLYFLLPLTLLYAALDQVRVFNSIPENSAMIPSNRKLNGPQILNLIVLILIILAIALFIAGIIINQLADSIAQRYGYDRNLFYYGAFGGMGLAIFLAIIAILLKLKIDIARRIVIGIGFVGFVAVIPLVLAFALSENNVKKLFLKEGS